MDSPLALPNPGVWITRLTRTPSHPLDAHVDGIRARSNAAFRAVYDEVADDLLSFAFGMVSHRQTAEDVLQQAFVELVRSAHKFEGDGRALRAWLFRSVRFGCLDEYRRRGRRQEVPTARLPDTAVEDPATVDRLDPELEAALSALSPRQRSAVLLSNVAGLSGNEIAEVMGTSRRAVYGLVERGEAKLRELLGGDA